MGGLLTEFAIVSNHSCILYSIGNAAAAFSLSEARNRQEGSVVCRNGRSCKIHCGCTSKFDVFWDECTHFLQDIGLVLMSKDTPR